MFFVIKKAKIDELCETFPSTAANIKRLALDRRMHFMRHKFKMLDT